MKEAEVNKMTTAATTKGEVLSMMGIFNVALFLLLSA